jgi:NitT/TauT family transport system substrate-binding protein
MGDTADAFASEPEPIIGAVANQLGLPDAEVAALSPQMMLGLDQSLLLALEEEARWAIANRLVPGTQVPNYLEFIHPEALSAVRPRSVFLLR